MLSPQGLSWQKDTMQLAVPRYTQRAFPRYRHIPNQTPHPIIDPKGHSFEKHSEKAEYIPHEKWQHNALYLYGVDLFNHGFWWEAHEAWEAVWLTTKKTDMEGQYLQALIQFSAALIKLYSGNEKGFTNLWGEAAKKFSFCLGELDKNKHHAWMGLNLAKWLKKVEVFCHSINPNLIPDHPNDALLYASYPALILES